ncbi:MAG: cell division protein ZapA [Clostridia bacterium]|nr:cell division protein ZapA [Clostridia bacterium]
MEEKNKVSVRIYGQEYKISGNAPKEYILQLASYVDSKIIEIANNMKQYTTPMVTVLAAVNIADEFFKARREAKDAVSKTERYALEVKHKDRYLNELKASYLQFKQEAEKELQQMQEIKQELSEKSKGFESLNTDLDSFKKENTALKNELEALKQTMEQLKADMTQKDEEVEKLKKENQELENIYFDTEMMNVQLKKELEDLTKTA